MKTADMQAQNTGECQNFVHCAILGDGMVGKTCLTLSFTEEIFTDNYTATVFENYPGELSVTMIIAVFFFFSLSSSFFSLSLLTDCTFQTFKMDLHKIKAPLSKKYIRKKLSERLKQNRCIIA